MSKILKLIECHENIRMERQQLKLMKTLGENTTHLEEDLKKLMKEREELLNSKEIQSVKNI